MATQFKTETDKLAVAEARFRDAVVKINDDVKGALEHYKDKMNKSTTHALKTWFTSRLVMKDDLAPVLADIQSHKGTLDAHHRSLEMIGSSVSLLTESFKEITAANVVRDKRIAELANRPPQDDAKKGEEEPPKAAPQPQSAKDKGEDVESHPDVEEVAKYAEDLEKGNLSPSTLKVMAEAAGATEEELADAEFLKNFKATQCQEFVEMEKEIKEKTAKLEKKAAKALKAKMAAARRKRTLTAQASNTELQESTAPGWKKTTARFPGADPWMSDQTTDQWELLKLEFISEFYYGYVWGLTDPETAFRMYFNCFKTAHPDVAQMIMKDLQKAGKWPLAAPEKRTLPPPYVGNTSVINKHAIDAEVMKVAEQRKINPVTQRDRFDSVKNLIYSKYGL